jgi:antitoxin CcdA
MESRIINPKARKKPTNLSINSDLLQQAKALKINLSQTLEERLYQLILDKKKQDCGGEGNGDEIMRFFKKCSF